MLYRLIPDKKIVNKQDDFELLLGMGFDVGGTPFLKENVAFFRVAQKYKKSRNRMNEIGLIYL